MGISSQNSSGTHTEPSTSKQSTCTSTPFLLLPSLLPLRPLWSSPALLLPLLVLPSLSPQPPPLLWLSLEVLPFSRVLSWLLLCPVVERDLPMKMNKMPLSPSLPVLNPLNATED